MQSPMNWTSTKVPMWQIDCEEFRKVGRSFELRDVTTPEHESFVEAFSAKHRLKTKRHGTTVTFIL
jgi:hypothetical protein